MNENYGTCRENLVEKYMVSGMQGRGIKKISVNDDTTGLYACVIGDILRTMCENPKQKLIKNMPFNYEGTEQVPVVITLTKQGVTYLKNNIKTIIDNYKKTAVMQEDTFSDSTADSTLDDFLEDLEIPINAGIPKRNRGRKAYLTLERLDVVETKQGCIAVPKSPLDETSLLEQNVASSAPVYTVSNATNRR